MRALLGSLGLPPHRLGAPAHVVITGASGGLGRALAVQYAAPGRLISLSGRNVDRLAATARICADAGAHVVTQALDVTDAEAMKGWLEARDAEQAIDLLIANAGIGGADVVPPPTGEDGELARRILAVNTLGAINTVTPLLPKMVARRHGRIALVGSISGSIGLPQSPVYCASKAAVQIYAEALRRLVRPHGVRVTAVLPGFIDTPMSRSLDLPRPFCWPSEKAAARIAADIARGRRQSIFPWQLRFSIALQNYLPMALSDLILSIGARSTGLTNKNINDKSID